MLRVGLSGGIGSGKSTVARALARRGAVVIDADAIAREVVEPGQPGLAAVVERFGPEVLDGDGRLDRPALAALVFDDAAARADLNAIVHPLVAVETARRMAAAPADAVVVHRRAAAGRGGPVGLRRRRDRRGAGGGAAGAAGRPGDVRRRRPPPDGRPGQRRGAAQGGRRRPRQLRLRGRPGPPDRRPLGPADRVAASADRARADTVTPRRYDAPHAASSSWCPISPRPATSRRRSSRSARGWTRGSGSRRCSASPGRGSRSPSPA